MFSIQGFLTCQSKLPMNYKHLSQVERYQIYALMKAGHDQTQIAKLLDRHKSTISRELSRNRGLKGCRPKQACATATKRSEKSRNAATMPPWVAKRAACLLKLQWSPEQIAGKLPVSHETLYQHDGILMRMKLIPTIFFILDCLSLSNSEKDKLLSSLKLARIKGQDHLLRL